MLLLQSICFSDHDLAMLVPLIMDLKEAHDCMISSKPFYGDDTIKLFMWALTRYALFDQQRQKLMCEYIIM